MAFNPKYATVHNEGCDLHYWSRGTGPLILFIPGGSGHGAQHNNIMTYIAAQGNFTAATFDRRQMSASIVDTPKIISPPQQARDARAVIKALGFDKAIVFGCSLGGIVTFQFALDHPEMVTHAIAMEAPTTLLLDDASETFEKILSVNEAYLAGGVGAAFVVFSTMFRGLDDEGLPDNVPPPGANWVNFFQNEFLIISTYVPNLVRLKEMGVSVGLLRGERSKDAFYARTTEPQQQILGCSLKLVPGNHQAFDVETEKFAPALLEFLAELDQGLKK